jgi:hypothetical protein
VIETILVVQGAEHQAVCRGLQGAKTPPAVLSMPMGVAPVQRFLAEQPHLNSGSILVMGLCGSLQPCYPVGTAVLYGSIKTRMGNQIEHWSCDPELTQFLKAQLPTLPLVQGWTSEQFVNSKNAKQNLNQTYGVEVVDMEGKAILTTLTTAKIATLRVVSDGAQDDLPNLDRAISAEGKLLPLPLITSLLTHPIGAMRLIQGSLKGLQMLQQVTAMLFASS